MPDQQSYDIYRLARSSTSTKGGERIGEVVVVQVLGPEPHPTRIMKKRFTFLVGFWVAAAVGVYLLASWLSLPSLVQREFSGASLQAQPATGSINPLPLDKQPKTQSRTNQSAPSPSNAVPAKKSSTVVSASASRYPKSVTVIDPLYPCSLKDCDPTDPPWCPPPGSREKRPCRLWPPGGGCPPPYLLVPCIASGASTDALPR